MLVSAPERSQPIDVQTALGIQFEMGVISGEQPEGLPPLNPGLQLTRVFRLLAASIGRVCEFKGETAVEYFPPSDADTNSWTQPRATSVLLPLPRGEYLIRAAVAIPDQNQPSKVLVDLRPISTGEDDRFRIDIGPGTLAIPATYIDGRLPGQPAVE